MTNENPETGNPATGIMVADDSSTAVPTYEKTLPQVEKALSELTTGPFVQQNGAIGCPERFFLQPGTGHSAVRNGLFRS